LVGLPPSAPPYELLVDIIEQYVYPVA